MDLHGNSSAFLSTRFSSFASAEYPTTDLTNLAWLGGGEAEIKLFSLEIQRSLSLVYHYRIFGTLAYRGVFYDDGGSPAAQGNPLGSSFRLAQSLVLRLGAVFNPLVIADMPFRASVHIWGAWKISNMYDNDPANDFSFGPVFSLEI
jgi:hypothetical protein